MRKQVFGRALLVLLAISAPARAQDAPGWVLGLGAGETYDTNVRFRSEGLPNELVSRLTASLARGWTGPRHTFGLTGSGTGMLFRQRTELSRLTYTAGATLDLKLSNRLRFGMSDRYTDALTSQFDDFVDEGAILPLTRSKRNRAAADLKYALSPATSLALDGRHDFWDFDDPTLENGWRIATGLDLAHRFGERKTGSLRYGYTSNRKRGTPGEVHAGSLGWSQVFGARLRTTASVGVSQIRASGQSATRMNWGASLDWGFERSALTANYGRQSKTSFAVGRQRVVDAVRLGYTLRLTRSLGAGVMAGYARSTDPFDPSFVLDAQNYGATLSWAIRPDLSLAGSYTYLRRDAGAGDGDAQDAHRASLSLAYRKAF